MVFSMGCEADASISGSPNWYHMSTAVSGGTRKIAKKYPFTKFAQFSSELLYSVALDKK